MIVSLKEQLADWKYGRGIVLKFISDLSDDDLDKKLPRNQLNTIRLQIEELAMIQKNYVDALTTRKIAFEGNQLDDKSKQGLVQELARLDKKLEETLETFDGTEIIKWFGEEWNVHRHISALIGHEQMHIGQIVAFCYATRINIPDDVTSAMALDG